MTKITSTKSLILKESILLFGKYGYSNVPLRKVANAVGIQVGSIYNHFASKEDLLDSIIDYFIATQQCYFEARAKYFETLKIESISQVMNNINITYSSEDVEIMVNIIRIIFMEHYLNERIGLIYTKYFLEYPRETIIFFLKILIDNKKLDPNCDIEGVAEVIVGHSISIAVQATKGSFMYKNTELTNLEYSNKIVGDMLQKSYGLN